MYVQVIASASVGELPELVTVLLHHAVHTNKSKVSPVTHRFHQGYANMMGLYNVAYMEVFREKRHYVNYISVQRCTNEKRNTCPEDYYVQNLLVLTKICQS